MGHYPLTHGVSSRRPCDGSIRRPTGASTPREPIHLRLIPTDERLFLGDLRWLDKSEASEFTIQRLDEVVQINSLGPRIEVLEPALVPIRRCDGEDLSSPRHLTNRTSAHFEFRDLAPPIASRSNECARTQSSLRCANGEGDRRPNRDRNARHDDNPGEDLVSDASLASVEDAWIWMVPVMCAVATGALLTAWARRAGR